MFVFALVSDSPFCIASKLNERACMCLTGWTAPFLEPLIVVVEGFKKKKKKSNQMHL